MLYNKLKFLKYILLPFQIIYSIIILIRNILYNTNTLHILHARPLIVSIGNLNTGGAGKTPMTEYLIRLFMSKKLAVLSRGYKRQTKEFIIAQKHHSALEIGDENKQLYAKFPHTIIACDNNRANGIKALMEHDPEIDIVILDDAFQHRKLHRDIDVLLTEHSNLFINDQLIPIGYLREHKKEAKRADIIIITKCPKNISYLERDIIKTKINPHRNQKIYFSYIDEPKYINLTSSQEIIIKKHETHILITGIANTNILLNNCLNENINYIHLKFQDHHRFTDKDMLKILELKENKNISKNLLLTEKDYYRLSEKHKKNLEQYFQLICIQIEFNFIGSDTSDFNNELLNFKKSKL